MLITIVLITICAYARLHQEFAKRVAKIHNAAIVSPLPEVVVEVAEVPEAVGYQKPYRFSTDWVSRVVAVWKKLLEPLRGRPGVQYLEIGVFEGRSLIWMLENILTDATARATAVDVFEGSYKDTYLHNIQESGWSGKVATLTGFSQVVLRKLPLHSFDVIYVDGSHAKGDVLEDAVLSWRLLKKEGLMIFDDYQHIGAKIQYDFSLPQQDDKLVSPKPAIDAFVQCFEDRCEVVHNGYQLIIRKKGE
jgi:hypothetical protein